MDRIEKVINPVIVGIAASLALISEGAISGMAAGAALFVLVVTIIDWKRGDLLVSEILRTF